MAMPSAYKANHQNNFKFDPIQTKHTSIMDGLMEIYGTWKAIPADIRYSITGSDRDLNEAIQDGSLNAAGGDATELGSFRKWQEKNPDGTYEDYAKYKKAQELADFKSKWNIVNGKGEEKTTETTTTTDANGKTEGTTTETTKEEGEPAKTETHEFEVSNGLPEEEPEEDDKLPMSGYRPNSGLGDDYSYTEKQGYDRSYKPAPFSPEEMKEEAESSMEGYHPYSAGMGEGNSYTEDEGDRSFDEKSYDDWEDPTVEEEQLANSEGAEDYRAKKKFGIVPDRWEQFYR